MVPRLLRCRISAAVRRKKEGKASAKKGYPLIDVYADSPIQEENEKKYQPNDGLHMAQKGYEALAGFLAERLPTIDPRLQIE